ncbi:MAG: T9SS type A sorting domain-containing protein [Ferruginibacter sp.]
MRGNSTLPRNIFIRLTSLTAIILFLNLSTVSAQQPFCTDEIVYWSQDFGTGTTPSDDPDVLTSGLTYQATGPLTNEGVYRCIDNTHQKPEWHTSPDHTPGDVNGKMLVINGQAENFYRHVVFRPQGFAAGFYSASLYLLNVNTPGTCAPNPLLPLINFQVQYRDVNDNWVDLVNSPVTSGSIPQTAQPVWVRLGAVFTLPATGSFVVKRIRLRLADGIVGGCGNDFAVDDIQLASCPSGSQPVTFVNIGAAQKGSGALVSWSTSMEQNNSYFQVERSANAGQTWDIVAVVKGAINSNTMKYYSAYDAKPVAGTNYYRVKQVDIDGKFAYSKTVSLKLNIENTAVSVIANPFYSNITVDFLSNRNQVVNYRLADVTGKQILSQQISIIKGSSRKVIDNLSRLSNGVYILQVRDDKGAMLYNDKVIKQ